MEQIHAVDRKMHGTLTGKTTMWTSLRGILRQIVARREIHQDLGTLSDRYLKDVGVTRHDLHIVSSASVLVDAVSGLGKRANERSTNW